MHPQLLSAALLLLLHAGAAAQAFSLAPHTARNGGLPDTPPLVGLSATAWTGPVGIRAGAGMDLPSSPLASLFRQPPAEATTAWHGELDLVLNMGRAGLRLGSVDPILLSGFGVHGRRLPHGEAFTIPVWSYGGGASVRMRDWVSMDLEARYRMPHETDADALPVGIGGGWEARLGLALHVGGRTATGARGRVATRPAGTASGRSTRTRSPGAAAPAGPLGAPGVGGPARHAPARDADAEALARATLATADRYVGVPYVWGGDAPSRGFDCSGFVRYVFARQGVTLPRVSRDQARVGLWVEPRINELRPGDLMFYAGRDGVVNHVAIYAGDNRIIHSSASGRGVRYDDLGSSRGRYYATRMVAARRVIGAGPAFGAH